MSTLQIKDSNGYIIFPNDIPLIDINNLLYGSYTSGAKSYTATQNCIAFVRGAGQTSTPTSVTRNGVTNTIPGQFQYISVQLNAGDTISFPGYSNWPLGLYVYGIKYPETSS